MSDKKSTKLQTLELLKKSKDWISGESISEVLGLSRVAVGKQIAVLRAEGYLIEAAPRRGYLLKMEPDFIDLDLIKKGITTKIIGQVSQVSRVSRAGQVSQAGQLERLGRLERADGPDLPASPALAYGPDSPNAPGAPDAPNSPDAPDSVNGPNSPASPELADSPNSAEWVYLKKTTSTNNEAATLGIKGAKEGSLVLADLQTQGRGRKGRKWFSPPRSLHFSVLLRPNLPAQKLSLLTLLACLAVQKVLSEITGLQAQIKWPNVILLHGKKVGAILVEANIVGGEVAWAVIGIGCNINVVPKELPEDLRQKITSTFAETGIVLSRNQVYIKLINQLDYYYNLLLQGKAADIVLEWKAKADILGKNLQLLANGQTISGQVLDLNEDGLLVVQDRAGKEHQIEVGDYTLG